MANQLSGLISQLKEPIKKFLQDKFLREVPYDKIKEAEGKSRNLTEGAAQQLQDAGEAVLDSMVEGLMRSLNELGSGFTLLAIGTAGLVSRIAGAVAGIISITPVGPGVSPNLLLPLLLQLKGEGDNLSKVYDEVENKLSEVEPLIGEVPGMSALISTIKATLITAMTACLAVGASCGGQEAKMPNPDAPEAEKYEASDCDNYTPDTEHASGNDPSTGQPWEKKVEWCTKFCPMIPEKSIKDFEDIPGGQTAQEQYDTWLANWIATERAKNPCGFSCNDCKFFKK